MKNFFAACILTFTFVHCSDVEQAINTEQFDTNDTALLQGATSKKWHHPSNIQDHKSLAGTEALLPSIAMDKDGNAVVAWLQIVSNSYQIFKAEYRQGQWTKPQSLNEYINPTGSVFYFPKVAMDDKGNALIVWGQTSNTGHIQVFKAELHPTTGWTLPTSLSDYISLPNSQAMAPEVAMNNKNEAIITWIQYDGAYSHIFKAEYTNHTWTYPTSLADHISPAGSDAFNPKVVLNNATPSKALITWGQKDTSYNNQIFMAERIGQTWATPSSLIDHISPAGSDASYAQSAIANNGDWTIVWFQHDGSNEQIFKAQYFGNAGGLTLPSSLTDNISPDGSDAFDPKVAMDGHGHVIIVWQQNDASIFKILKAEYAQNAWILPTLSDAISFSGTNASSPSVSADHHGNAVLIWNQVDNNTIKLYKSRYNPNNQTWAYPAAPKNKISFNRSDVGHAPSVVTNSGKAFISWSQNDGTYEQVFVSEYR